ncbi:Uncharacterised protein [uncultured archaeon]|nr:Uncharacterised protein [uncultured archaeon]
MADRALAAKKPETKKESPPQVRKVEHFQSVSSPVDRILYLQRTAGNQAVQGLIRSGALQAKLRVGPPGDKYEEEADRIAQQVVAFKRAPSPGSIARTTGTQSLLDEGKREVRRKTEPASGTSIIPVNDSYILNPGSGEPLNTSTRGSIESYTGADLGNVRVHDDSASHAAAGALNARAFTYREHIWLGRGESKTDLRLMAHETTHVLQQGASVQRLPVAVTPAPRVIQRGLLDYLGDPKEKLLEKAAQWVDNIPGFYLLTVILGKNPVTDKPVERNAINLIRGFLGLVPGGEAIFQNLQKSGAIDQAFAWLNDQIAKLNLTWDYIKSLFRQAWDALSATDIFSPGKAIEKIKAVFGPPLERIKNFAVAVGKKIAEFIFEGVLKLAGPLGTRVLEIVKKAGDVLSTIIHDPIGFVGNLIQAVRKGFDQFSTNILVHLKEGLMKWLFGALARAGLRLPEKFDLMGILSLVLQILALTYDRLRGLLVKAIGEKPVAYLEKTFEFLTTLVTKGLGAAWEKLVEFLGDLKEMVLGGIRDWVVTTIVKKAIAKVASMFNPVGAVIQAIIMVYDTIKFFIERFQQIAELANAVFESVANIAAGKIEAAAGYVEKTMARTIPVIIGFLASLIGLGGISQKIKDIIKSIQEKVESALSKLVNFIVGKVKGLLGKDKEGKPEKAEAPDERWDNGVKGVKAALAQLEKEGISEEKVKAQLPKWKTDFGFKELSIDTKQKPWVIVGEMSPAKTVSTVEIKPIKPLLDGKDYERIRQGQLIDLDDYINPSGQQFPSRSLSPDYKSPKDTKNRTNAERAKAGRTPFLYNNDFVELHHTNQDFFSELDEHSHVFHQSVVDDPDYHPFAGDSGYMTWREWFGFYNGQIRYLGYIYNRIREKYWRRRF